MRYSNNWKNRISRWCGALLAVVLLVSALAVPAAAETIESQETSEVVLTSSGKLESTFHDDVVDDTISEYLEPGDSAVFTIQLRNDNTETADFWMDRRTIDSLEVWGNDPQMTGGGYSYVLTYEGPGGFRTLYSSLKIEGEDFQANTSSDMVIKKIDENSYIFLDTYETGKGGVIKLTISLDGETQGNDYQDTLADLAMDFAVELSGADTVIKTGDVNRSLPYFIAMTGAGVVLLILGICLTKKRGKRGRVS